MKKQLQDLLQELKRNSTVEKTETVSIDYMVERLEDILIQTNNDNGYMTVDDLAETLEGISESGYGHIPVIGIKDIEVCNDTKKDEDWYARTL